MSLRNQLRVLVVDDMSVSRGLIVQALEWMGIRNVEVCNDAPEATKRLASRPAHLVISDYNMPGSSGLDLLHTLRTNKATQRIGFILITGKADRSVVERGQKLGMNNYITKPFAPESLKTCIERVVGPL